MHRPATPTIADKLGISVNTVAKYVGLLEEHGLIATERTNVITRDGLKRNGCLRYTILPIQMAIDQFYERQLAELEQAAAQQRARRQAEKSGVAFIQAKQEPERMTPPVSPCGPLPGGAPCPSRLVWSGVIRLWEALQHKASGPF